MESFIRRKIFSSINSFKKFSIDREVKELKENFSSREYMLEQRNLKLEKFLEHATTTTEYYSKFKGCRSINDFPILRKSDIKENYDLFVSDKYRKDDLLELKTSGSYGVPFRFLVTKEKKVRLQSQVVFFNEQTLGYQIGDKHAYIRVCNNKGKLKLFAQNEILLNPSTMDRAWLEDAAKIIKHNKKLKYIVGYTSAVTNIAKYIYESGGKSEEYRHIRGISVSAEPVTEDHKLAIKNIFKCPVLSRYATEELGILAHECNKEHSHHLNDSDFYIEVLKLESDEPAEVGELGRIIITDLYSKAMPLIRYELGDLVIMKEECKCGFKGRVIEKIQGRIVETIYDSLGKNISPYAFNIALRDINAIRQFQFIQKDEKLYELNLVIQEGFNSKDLILKRFKKILGDEAIINIIYVEDIKPLKSGKRPYIINEYKSTIRR